MYTIHMYLCINLLYSIQGTHVVKLQLRVGAPTPVVKCTRQLNFSTYCERSLKCQLRFCPDKLRHSQTVLKIFHQDKVWFINFSSGQICLSPTPIGGATPRYDLDLSPFIRLSRQDDTAGSQNGVTFQDAKLACQVSLITLFQKCKFLSANHR